MMHVMLHDMTSAHLLSLVQVCCVRAIGVTQSNVCIWDCFRVKERGPDGKCDK